MKLLEFLLLIFMLVIGFGIAFIDEHVSQAAGTATALVNLIILLVIFMIIRNRKSKGDN